MKIDWFRIIGHIYALLFYGVPTYLAVSYYVQKDTSWYVICAMALMQLAHYALGLLWQIGIERRKPRYLRIFRKAVLYRGYLPLLVIGFFNGLVIYNAFTEMATGEMVLDTFMLLVYVLGFSASMPIELWIIHRLRLRIDPDLQSRSSDIDSANNSELSLPLPVEFEMDELGLHDEAVGGEAAGEEANLNEVNVGTEKNKQDRRKESEDREPSLSGTSGQTHTVEVQLDEKNQCKESSTGEPVKSELSEKPHLDKTETANQTRRNEKEVLEKTTSKQQQQHNESEVQQSVHREISEPPRPDNQTEVPQPTESGIGEQSDEAEVREPSLSDKSEHQV